MFFPSISSGAKPNRRATAAFTARTVPSRSISKIDSVMAFSRAVARHSHSLRASSGFLCQGITELLPGRRTWTSSWPIIHGARFHCILDEVADALLPQYEERRWPASEKQGAVRKPDHSG